ncbi:unnamed protein product, partial [Strongylus vulgaris]
MKSMGILVEPKEMNRQLSMIYLSATHGGTVGEHISRNPWSRCGRVDYDDEQRFLSLYEDMIRKGRYFAVDLPNDSFFKDMYLLPLPSDEEPP